MKPTVLFVDDDQALLLGLRRVLHKEPYEILTATSGFTAMDILADTQVDVIVSDEKMPGVSGTELLSLAAKKYPSTVRIMLTGNANLETAVKAINNGEIYRFLTKPCNEVELGVCLRQALQHRELLTQARRMLETIRMQSSYIECLEKEVPGISKINKDKDGAIVIEDESCDVEALLKEICKELGD